jgi:hypothetical protein
VRLNPVERWIGSNQMNRNSGGRTITTIAAHTA